MDFGFYILLNHFLRVDQIIFKSMATRYYHDFSTNYLIRETRTNEDTFESIIEVLNKRIILLLYKIMFYFYFYSYFYF